MPPPRPLEPRGRGQTRIAPWWPARFAALLSCILLVSPAARPQNLPSQYDVQAAYLFNFGKFIRLAGGQPVVRGGSFDICILGTDLMGRTLDELVANETIDTRPVHVMRLNDASQARSCAIVYISRSEGKATGRDLALLAGSNALTVGAAPDFLERGGMIQFVLDGDHVRFKVNLNAVNRTHLVLSSELLRVAAEVVGKPMPEGAR